MAIISISEAARLTSKSRTTIQKYIKQGKLSKTSDEHGNIGIDISELLRVFGSFSGQADSLHTNTQNGHNLAAKSVQVVHDHLQHAQPEHSLLIQENKSLKREIELLQQLIDEKDKRNDDLKSSLLLLENKMDENLNIPSAKINKSWWKIFSN